MPLILTTTGERCRRQNTFFYSKRLRKLICTRYCWPLFLFGFSVIDIFCLYVVFICCHKHFSLNRKVASPITYYNPTFTYWSPLISTTTTILCSKVTAVVERSEYTPRAESGSNRMNKPTDLVYKYHS